MQVTRFRDPRLFLRHAEPFLLRAEAENNLLLGVAEMTQAFGEDAYVATVDDRSIVVACGLRTPPYKAVISRAEPPAIECLIADMAEKYPDLAQVHGPERTVTSFADLWATRTGVPSTRGTKHRLFEIREAPNLIAPPAGRLRLAAERDLPTIIAWSAAFIAEVMPGDPTDPEAHAVNRIATRSLFVWENGEPLAMAGWAGRTARGVRVNFVYTPPEHRGRGYATACVARLTQRLLGEGRAFCCLYTDLSNPTSNSIYRKIGYRPIGDSSDYILNSRKADTIR